MITDVNRTTWTMRVETRHSAKTVEDISVLSPYHHFLGGEGIHHMPEVGAVVYLAWPSDNTPPFILGYMGVPSVLESDDGTPRRSNPDGEPSNQDVSLRSRRPDMNPGDIAITTRDENFLFLRRGGIVQIGATPISQRIYIPVLNYIKDFAENYEMHCFGGDVSWIVQRQEHDPGGDAPATHVFHMNTHAQDAKATVRVRHMALSGTDGGDRTAWEVVIAPESIDRDTGEYSSEVYTLSITTAGDKTELVGANRVVTVRGDDTLDVDGNRSVSVTGDNTVTARNVTISADQEAVFAGATVRHGSQTASNPHVLGQALVQWLSTMQLPVATVGAAQVASPSPGQIAALQTILSRKVFLE